jgi:hypothetical protein
LTEEPPVEVAQELRELQAIDVSSVSAAARRHLSRQHRLVVLLQTPGGSPRAVVKC